MLKRSDLAIGAVVLVSSMAVASLLSVPSPGEWVLTPGHMTPGHARIPCGECHKPAPGTIRQQAQANIRYWIGLRDQGAYFRTLPVTAAECSSCHIRKADAHPTYRFREPRFLDAVNRLDARNCLSCHVEHRGRRVLAKADQCELCHDRLVVKNDPLDVPHSTLIAKSDWSSCLSCHDYHGNHQRKAQTTFVARFPRATVEWYMADGPSPYGDTKKEKVKKR